MPNRRRRHSPKTHRRCNKRKLNAAKQRQTSQAPYPRSQPIPEKEMVLFIGLPSWGWSIAEAIKEVEDDG